MLRRLATVSFAVGLLAFSVDQVAASPIQIKYSGTLVSGGTVGSNITGTATFWTGLPDLLPGNLEDWWENASLAAFTFNGDGIHFSTSAGSDSSLRIKDGLGGEDALMYVGVQGANSLSLLLSQGGVDALLTGTGNLTGSVPLLFAIGSHFAPCAIPANGTLFTGSCSQFATQDGAMLFQITTLSIEAPHPVPEPASGVLLITGVIGVGAAVTRRARI